MASVKTTITEQGLALMNAVIANSAQITFTAMAVGDGVNVNTSSLVTDMINKRIDVEISKVYVSDEGSVVSGNVKNDTLQESFEIREVGVFAKQKDSTEAPILFAYTECEGIGGIPAASIMSVNSEINVTIVTGKAEVVYFENPDASLTRQDIKELKDRLDNNYFTKIDIRTGVQTQSILGYDVEKGKITGNGMYLDGDTLELRSGDETVNIPAKSGTVALIEDIESNNGNVWTVPQAVDASLGANKFVIRDGDTIHELEIPKAYGTLALKSDVDSVKTEAELKVQLLKNNPPQVNNNANSYGYRGTLRSLGAFGDAVVVGKLSVLTRDGYNENANVSLWARILKAVDGQWVVAAQSKKSRKWNDVSAGSELTWEMEAVAGVTPPSADEEIAIVWVNSKTATAQTSNGSLSFKTVPVSGGLNFELTNVPTTTSSLASWCPWIGLAFAPMCGEKRRDNADVNLVKWQVYANTLLGETGFAQKYVLAVEQYLENPSANTEWITSSTSSTTNPYYSQNPSIPIVDFTVKTANSTSPNFSSFNASINVPIFLPNAIDCTNMLINCTKFNKDLHLHSATICNRLLQGATAFASQLSVPNAVDCSHMLNGASAFNQPLYLPNATNCVQMLYAATLFNQPLSLPKAIDCRSMLQNATSFKQAVYLPSCSNAQNAFNNTKMSAENISATLDSLPTWTDGGTHIITFTGATGASELTQSSPSVAAATARGWTVKL